MQPVRLICGNVLLGFLFAFIFRPETRTQCDVLNEHCFHLPFDFMATVYTPVTAIRPGFVDFNEIINFLGNIIFFGLFGIVIITIMVLFVATLMLSLLLYPNKI